MTDRGARQTTAPVYALLTLRFLLELALLAAYVVAPVRLIDGVLGWVVGLLLAAAGAAVWGVLLSPRRPVHLALAARLVVELALFAAAAVLLALSGLVPLGAGLVVLELLDLGLLRGPDTHAL